MDGKLHIYDAPFHVLFEYTHHQSSQSSSNVLLFIGGLGDTFETVPYVSAMAQALPNWRVCHAQLSSAGKGWGMSSLDQDCDEIELAVKWAKTRFVQQGDSAGVNVVLIGHSTGCQDVLHYLHSTPRSGEGRSPVQGAILQAPVSDRDSLLSKIEKDPEKKAIYGHCVKFANSLDEDEKNDMIIPLPWSEEIISFNRTPVSVARFLSLASPESPKNPAPDDLFSYDATNERLESTFGKIGSTKAFAVTSGGRARKKPSILIGMMGADEYVPANVDMDVLLLRWKKAIEKDGIATLDENSGIVKGGKHNLRGRDGERKNAQDDFVRRVKAYLERVVGEADDRDANLGPEERLPHRPSL
jgi:predicted alpha/beta hydrolase family esterase